MSAAPLLAALFARALPGLAVRDLGLPLGALLPWLPGSRAGLAGPASPEERDLLARFRQHGMPLLGLDPIADAAPDPSWDAAADRLACSPVPVPGASLTLIPGGLADAALPEGRGRILLVAGSEESPERHDLLLPQSRLPALFERLRQAAAALAGPGWQQGARALSPRQASLLLLVPRPGHLPELILAAASLPHDLPVEGGPKGLLIAGTRQLRLLLGALPSLRWRLRLGFTGADPGSAVLFLDGLRQPSRTVPDALTATIDTPARRALVLGLAWRDGAPEGLHLASIEARP